MPPSTRGGPGWVTEPCFSRSRGRGPGGFGSGWGWSRAPSVPPSPWQLPLRLSPGALLGEPIVMVVPAAALTLGVTVLMSWWRSCQPPPSRCCHYRQLPTHGE